MLVLIHRFRHRVAFERLAGAVLWFFGTDLIPAAGVRYTQESNHLCFLGSRKDMLQSEEHFVNYCRYALALGALADA